MLGETVKEARIRKGLTQARLAKLADVSRRHLAALEKGANVSVNILQRVANVLDLTEISLGDLSLRAKERAAFNIPLLTDTIREAREDAERAQETLARVESLLGGDVTALDGRYRTPEYSFPRMPVRHVPAPHAANGDVIRDAPDSVEITTAGEIRHGEAINEEAKETVAIPRSLVEAGEIVFRARGDNMREQGIHDGDLLVVELRPRGRAASGELVIGRIGKQVFVGHWWQKHGDRALMSNGLSEVTMGRSKRSLKVVASINQILRIN